jgi:hypothetical protein
MPPSRYGVCVNNGGGSRDQRGQWALRSVSWASSIRSWAMKKGR